MIYNVVEQIRTEIKKYRFKRKIKITTAIALLTAMLGVLTCTGMKNAESYTVTVNADNDVIRLKPVKVASVSEVLCEAGIILGENDIVNFEAHERIYDGMEIKVDRVVYIDSAKSSAIPFETVYKESPLHKIGEEFISTEGKIGCEIVTYSEKLVNGVVTESKIKYTERYEPVTQVITVGTALNEPYSKRMGNFSLKDGVPTEYAYIVDGKVTAYTAPEGAGTYSGRKLEIGTVAVNPDIIPFGSELYICSKDGERVYGYAVAADTGDLTEVVADVFMGVTSENYGKACDWGAQFCDVYVLTVGDNSVSWM